jgi:hypothetical protein
MPLEKGSSSEVIGHNVKEMEAHGHSKEQSVAAALHTAYDFDDLMQDTVINDNMLSYGGGNPVQTPTGPGDKSFSGAVRNSNAIIDTGEYGRKAAEFLGRDNVPELQRELDKFLTQEEKEEEHQ